MSRLAVVLALMGGGAYVPGHKYVRDVIGLDRICREQELANLGTRRWTYDYISSYDLSQLPLDAVPFDIECSTINSEGWFTFCEAVQGRRAHCFPRPCQYPMSVARFRVEFHMELDDYVVRTDHYTIDAESCRFQDGHWEGWIWNRDGVITCTAEPEEENAHLYRETPGYTVEVVSLDRDLDCDGYRDALVRFRSHGGGGSGPDGHGLTALTRRSREGPLEILDLKAVARSQESAPCGPD